MRVSDRLEWWWNWTVRRRGRHSIGGSDLRGTEHGWHWTNKCSPERCGAVKVRRLRGLG